MAKKAKSVAGQTAVVNPGRSLSAEERHRMIAEAAYFRALRRGFTGGSALDDWLEAEREINRLLPGPQQQKEELAAYEKLRQSVRKILADMRETVNAEILRRAFDRAVEDLKKTGGYTAETVGRVAASLRKDLASVSWKMGPRWEAFTGKSSDVFGVWRDRSGQFLAQAATAVGEWLQQAGTRLVQQIYRTGGIADRGMFECTGCGERMVLHTPAHLPPCARCRKTEFRRV